MTRVAKTHLAVIVTATLLVAGLAFAQGYGTKRSKSAALSGSAAIKATVTGRNHCIGCALKGKGAASQCSVYGHRHVLEVIKAVAADGRPISDARNWVLHYLENDKSKDLVNGHHSETLEIKGKVYPRERVLEVVSFKTATAAKPRPRPEGT
jgi:hypothetical protein